MTFKLEKEALLAVPERAPNENDNKQLETVMIKYVLTVLACALFTFQHNANAAGGAACGGSAGKECSGPDEYCARPVGRCQAAGVCEKKPGLCPLDDSKAKAHPDVVFPVCGCDEKTYNNACEAQRAGVSVRSSGKCANAPKK